MQRATLPQYASVCAAGCVVLPASGAAPVIAEARLSSLAFAPSPRLDPAGSTGPGHHPQPELLDPRPAIEWRCRRGRRRHGQIDLITPPVPPRELREHDAILLGAIGEVDVSFAAATFASRGSGARVSPLEPLFPKRA